MTGLGSRIAALSRPLASAADQGATHLQARAHARTSSRSTASAARADARGGAVGAAEDDRAAHLAARHVERLGRRVDDLVDRLHGEVEGHELDDRLQPAERRADAQAGEAVLGDRRVDDALGAELLEQALADLVGALVLRDLLAHQEDACRRARISSAMASRSASRTVIVRRSCPVHLGLGGRRGGRRWLRGGRGCGAGFGLRSAPRPCGCAAGGGGRRCRWPRRRRSRLRRAACAIGVLTATPSVPSGTRICASVPSSTASTSIVALSVSISADHVAGLHRIADLDFATSPACPRSSSATAPASELRNRPCVLRLRPGRRSTARTDRAPGLCCANSAASLTISLDLAIDRP